MRVILDQPEEPVLRVEVVQRSDSLSMCVVGEIPDVLLALGPNGIERIYNVSNSHGLPLDGHGRVALAGETVLNDKAEEVLDRLRRFLATRYGAPDSALISGGDTRITLGDLRTLVENR